MTGLERYHMKIYRFQALQLPQQAEQRAVTHAGRNRPRSE
jgi:hypothetical protein